MTETKEIKEKTFTKKQVEELLKQQINDCSEAIDGNLSEYTAKCKIMAVKLVEF